METQNDIKVGILGSGNVGKDIHNNTKTPVITLSDTDVFSVNGVQYEPIEKPKRLPDGSIHSTIRDIYLHEYMELMDITNGSRYQRKLDVNIDIIKEFGLIELKKSELSKWEREEVIRLFNKKYKKYEKTV